MNSGGNQQQSKQHCSTKMSDCQPPGTHEPRQLLTDKLADILRKDGDIRKKLIEIYCEIQDFFNTDPDETLEEEMSAHYNDYEALLKNYAKDLTGDERPIVVTGETSAGKSSVLNLLFGFNVLPTSTLACTGAICRLHTSETKRADIIDLNDKKIQTIMMEGDDEEKFAEDLSACIDPKKERNQHHIKYVDIYWPIPFLTKNVIVVDTPGIGESDEMTERLVRYLPNAIALIYVINPINAGGIAKDRIVPLFKAIQGQDKNGIRQAFDPACAIFLCNKWDLIPKKEENEVLEHIRKQLELYWPNIQEKQIFHFSVTKTLERMTEHQTLPEDFIQFKRGIEQLIEASLCAKSRQHILWLERFLMTLCIRLNSHLMHIALSEHQKKKQMDRGLKLLKMLEDCRETSKGKLKKEAVDECNRLAKAINTHMHDENNKEKMFPWHRVRLPNIGFDMAEIEAKANVIIQNMVSDELNKCLRQYGGQDTLDKLMAKVRKETKGIKKAQYFIEQLLQKPDELDDVEVDTLDDINLPEYIDEFSNTEIAVIVITSPLWFPLALVGGVLVVPWAIVSAIKGINQVADYARNKKIYMTNWANKYLDNITEQSVYAWLTDSTFGNFYQNLNNLFDEELPQIISGCRKLFDDLQNEVRSAESICHNYKPKLKRCNQIQKKLQAISFT